MNQRKLGIILSYLTLGTSSLVQLVYVPMLLHFLTKEEYGIYQLMGSMIAYLAIMDFGLSNTTTRYLAQAIETKNKNYFNQIVGTSHSIYLIIAGLLIVLGIGFYFFITPIYASSLTIYELETAKKVFIVLLFNIAIFIPSNIFLAVINAYEGFFFVRGLNLLKAILQPLLVWGILSYKADVLNLVLVQTGFTLFVIILNYLYCKIKLKINFHINFANKSLIKELTSFSLFVFLHSLMDQIYWRSGQLILGAVNGATAVATYAISMQISIFVIFLPTTMGNVFLPKLSALVTNSINLKEINAIFLKLGRLQYIFMMLLIVGFAFLGNTFLTLWIGDGYSACYPIALLIMCGYILDVSQNVGISILQALNKHAFRAYVYLAMAVLNVGLAIPLAKKYGGIGCAISTTTCLLIGSGLAINWYYAKIGIDIKTFFSNLAKITLSIIPATFITFLVFHFWTITPNWINFLIHGVSLVAIYIAFIWSFAFNTYEKELFTNPLKIILSKIK